MINIMLFSETERIIHHSIILSTNNFITRKKCNDSIICCYENDLKIFGCILKFIPEGTLNYVEMKTFNTIKVANNFYRYTETDDIRKVVLKENTKKCQAFKINNLLYLSVLQYILFID